MSIKQIVNFGVISLFLLVHNVKASSEDFTLDVDHGSYYVPTEFIVHPMAQKFFRGIINVSTGWGELPRQTLLTSLDYGVFKGVPMGVFKGILMTIIRTGTGIYDTGSFLSPSPGYFDPVIDPPFVWEQSIDMLSETF